MEFRKIWEIVWRRKWIIIQAFLVILLTAIGGSFLLTPVYETSAKVLIKSSGTEASLLSALGLQGITPVARTQDTTLDTPIALASVEPVLEKVILRLQLRDRNENLMKPSDLIEPSLIKSLIFPVPYVEIDAVEETTLIEITAGSCDPEEATMIANTLAEVYIEEDLKQGKEEYRSVREFIEGKIEAVKAEYLQVLEEIRKFKVAEKTVDLETETKAAIDKLETLMKEKEDTIKTLSENRAKIETLKDQLSRESETVTSSTAISENPQIENLKQKLTDFEVQLAQELIEKTPDHPDVVALKQKINKVREELKKEVELFKESSQELQNLERELAALESHVKGVNADIDRHMSVLYAIPNKTFNESQMELKLSATQDLYSSLLEYLYQVGVAEAMTISGITVVEPAQVPEIDKPESPNKVLNGIMGMFLGLMFGFGLGFLVDYLDDTIKTPEEVKEQGLTILGTIPKMGRKESHIISETDPKDPLSESYRTVRNSIKFVSLDKPVKTLLITSPLPGEGKTTTAVNLAISMTRDKKQILLMDTDFSNPGISRIFGMSGSIGITNILANEAIIEEAVQKTDIEGLSLLATGPTPPDPGQMIESQKMKQLIKDVSQKYDFIILDSPPVLLINDAVVLARYVDASILLLESGKTTG
ncbi:MAG: polysaccharide biosynthesis tyrosine autokinase, partial [Pseudomonadota bacterium]